MNKFPVQGPSNAVQHNMYLILSHGVDFDGYASKLQNLAAMRS